MVGGIKFLNMNYYITQGEIKEIGEIKTYSNNFTKREVVITTYDDGYPEDVKMDFIGDKSKMMDDFNVEDLVIVAFKIKSNLYNGKYFINLNIIAIGELTDDEKIKRIKTKPYITEVKDGDDYIF